MGNSSDAETDSRVAAGRQAFERRAWADARDALVAAAEVDGLDLDDLERLGIAAHLSGRSERAVATLEQLHHRSLALGDIDRAARWAVWLAIILAQAGQHARGGGWLSRGRRVLDDVDADVAARGYLLVPVALQRLDRDHDPAAALACFDDVARIADRFDDPDLTVMGLLGRGQCLVAMGDVDRGLPLLDEVMVAVTSSDVSPIMAGLAYCAVIRACRDVFDLRRAQEWTEVLSRWCEDQRDLQPYRGQCLVHRSEILQLHGEWATAMREVDRACEHLAANPGDPVMGMARYQQAELLRLRGEFRRAEVAYREAGAWGHTTQPGLALLWLVTGRTDRAVAALRDVARRRQGDRVRRAGILGALVEVLLTVDEVTAAAEAVEELERIASELDSTYLRAVASESDGAVLDAQGETGEAIAVLRTAWRSWQALGAPYESARVRLRIARACHDRGDDETAAVELESARRTFERLGAAPAMAAVDALRQSSHGDRPGGLTPRELEVLRLVATGATNRQIADALVISQKTVARHLSNMYVKLDVGSRAAATAWAYEHGIV